MLLIEHTAPRETPASEALQLPFEDRCKSRLRARLASGEECGLFLPRGGVLRGGDKLCANDGRIVEVRAAPEALLAVTSDDPLLLTRAAYHLGNRHVAVQLLSGGLRLHADPVLGELLRGLGLAPQALLAPFEPESGAYGAAAGDDTHARAHGMYARGHTQGGSARIHDHFVAPSATPGAIPSAPRAAAPEQGGGA